MRIKSIVKKLSFLLPVLFFACEKIPTEVIETEYLNLSIIGITAPSHFSYSENNQDLVTSVEFDNSNTIENVWFSLLSVDGNEEIADSILMVDNGNVLNFGDQTAGDNIFTGKYTFSDQTPAGEYLLEYFVKDNVYAYPNNQRKIAFHKFVFDKGEQNVAPVLSELSMPDSILRGQTFIFTVKATDVNGLNDIKEVYFNIYRPPNDEYRGTVLMVDNGDYEHFGDLNAGDGIYSYRNSFAVDANTGVWKFEFQAKDRSNALSNIIVHNITVD